MRYSDIKFNNSEFVKIILPKYLELWKKYYTIKESAQNRFIDIDSYGTKKELQIKLIFKNIELIREFFSEFKILNNLGKIDRKKLNLLFGNKISDEDYFSYHYDNYIVRIMTAIDLCGKLGCAVYDIKVKNDSWFKFINSIEVKGSKMEELFLEFSKFLDEYREHRHSLVHEAKRKDNKFEKIVYWETIGKKTKLKFPKNQIEILNSRTDKDLQSEILELNKLFKKTVDYTYEIVDLLIPELKNQLKQ
jgi:hypothetical protein